MDEKKNQVHFFVIVINEGNLYLYANSFQRPYRISKATFPRTLKPLYVTSSTVYWLEKLFEQPVFFQGRKIFFDGTKKKIRLFWRYAHLFRVASIFRVVLASRKKLCKYWFTVVSNNCQISTAFYIV